MSRMTEQAAAGTHPSEDSERVDALLTSALADQAREKRELAESIHGAKAALARAEQEMAEIKQFIARRDEELLARIDERLDSRLGAIEESIIKLAGNVSALPAKVRADLETAAVAIDERMAEEMDSLLSSSRQDAVEMVTALSKLSDRQVDRLSAPVGQLSDVVTRSVEAAREEYRATIEQLSVYLGERDDKLQRARDQVLIDLFKQLALSLGKRNSRKVSAAIAQDPDLGSLPVRTVAAQGPFWKSPKKAGPDQTKAFPAPGPAHRPDPFAGVAQSLIVQRPEPLEPLDAAPITRSELARDYLVAPAPGQPAGSGTSEKAVKLFGSMAAEDAPAPRRRRTRPPEAAQVKAPPKAPGRRKP